MSWGNKGIKTGGHTCNRVPHRTYRNGKIDGAYYVCGTCGRRM